MSFSLRCFASLLSVAISCCMYLLDAHFLQREVDVPFAHSHPVRRVAVTYEDLRSLVLGLGALGLWPFDFARVVLPPGVR